MAINVPSPTPSPRYERRQPIVDPAIGQVGQAVSQAGQKIGQFANQREKVRMAYEEMLRKRQEAIMSNRMEQAKLDEAERHNKEQEKLTDRQRTVAESAERREGTKAYNDKLEADRLQIKRDTFNKLIAAEDPKKLTHGSIANLAAKTGLSLEDEAVALIGKFVPRSQGNTFVLGQRRTYEVEDATNAYEDAVVREAGAWKQLKEVENTPDEDFVKTLTYKNFLTDVPEAVNLPTAQVKQAAIKYYKDMIAEIQKEKTKWLGEGANKDKAMGGQYMQIMNELKSSLEETQKMLQKSNEEVERARQGR